MGMLFRWMFVVLALVLPCLTGCGPASTSNSAAEAEVQQAAQDEANMAPDPAEIDEEEEDEE